MLSRCDVQRQRQRVESLDHKTGPSTSPSARRRDRYEHHQIFLTNRDGAPEFDLACNAVHRYYAEGNAPSGLPSMRGNVLPSAPPCPFRARLPDVTIKTDASACAVGAPL